MDKEPHCGRAGPAPARRPTAALNLIDGSGVGRLDRVTPVALTTLLQRIADKSSYPKLAPIYYGGGLPLAGRSGRLGPGTSRFVTRPTSCARGKLRAKPGSLFDPISLSGLTVGRDGQLKAFSILVNSRPRRVSALTTRGSVDRIAVTVNGCYSSNTANTRPTGPVIERTSDVAGAA